MRQTPPYGSSCPKTPFSRYTSPHERTGHGDGDHAQKRLHPPSQPYRLLAAGRSGPDSFIHRPVQGMRNGCTGHHRPRQHVRRAEVLQGMQGGRHQAHHRKRILHEPPRQKGHEPDVGGAQPRVPSDPSGDERQRLPPPDGAHHACQHRGLLLQAQDRRRDTGEPQRRPDLPVGMSGRRDPAEPAQRPVGNGEGAGCMVQVRLR